MARTYDDVILVRKKFKKIMKRNGIQKENMPSISIMGNLLVFRKFKNEEDLNIFKTLFHSVSYQIKEFGAVAFTIILVDEVFDMNDEELELFLRLQ